MDLGARLREAREARGLTIEEIARSTRVQPRILTAIEQNDVASLPTRPYGRGFVRSYAAEVGLDPDATVRDYFSQFAPVPDAPRTTERAVPLEALSEPSTPRGWLWTSALVLTYAAVGAIVIAVGRWTMQPDVEVGAVGTSGVAAPAPSTRPEPGIPQAPSVAKAGSSPSAVRVKLEAQRAVWVTAVADGERQVYRTLQPGERVALTGTREVSVRVGDAGAIVWQVNGQPPAPMGQPGEVRTERVTIQDAVRMK
jgi:transcriptional regulator with XRE-family HTH domain